MLSNEEDERTKGKEEFEGVLDVAVQLDLVGRLLHKHEPKEIVVGKKEEGNEDGYLEGEKGEEENSVQEDVETDCIVVLYCELREGEDVVEFGLGQEGEVVLNPPPSETVVDVSVVGYREEGVEQHTNERKLQDMSQNRLLVLVSLEIGHDQEVHTRV